MEISRSLCLVMMVAVVMMAAAAAEAGGPPRIEGHQQQVEALETVIRQGVHKVMAEGGAWPNFPASARELVERTVAERAANRILSRLRRLDAAFDQRFQLAKEFVESAVEAAASRSRWPNEAIVAHVNAMAAETQKQIMDLYEAAGLVEPAGGDPAVPDSRMSALDLEHLISDIIELLLNDPSFQELMGWLMTLPEAIHQIADDLFAGKTFEEIFAMLGGGGKGSKGQALFDLIVGDYKEGPVPPPPPAEVDASTFKLLQAGLAEARSTLSAVLEAYGQEAKERVGELIRLAEAERANKAPFIGEDVLEAIKSAAVRLMN